jgi:phage terminase large subunit
MSFDWKRPVYEPIWAERAERLARLRAHPELLAPLRQKYAEDPAVFINDWGTTFDPRNADLGLPTTIPFLLFPKQVELVRWMTDRWRSSENGIVEKTREMGMSWLAIAFACTVCLFQDGVVIGFGSRKEELVDKIDDPKSLFWKARAFLSALPVEFLRGWSATDHAPHMRVIFPATNSYLIGEGGDGIGRGNRASMYFLDESAFLERPTLIDASLSQTTRCRIDISTPNGMGNSFAQRRWSGNTKSFTYHWRNDPRKSQAWYEAECKKIDNPTVVAQELDINYAASAEGVLVPNEWVQAAIGAAERLGIQPTGFRIAGLDVADTGVDKNAIAGRHGICLQYLEQWSGRGSDIYATVVRALGVCDHHEYLMLDYDADGLGAGVRGDSRVINQQRRDIGKRIIQVYPYRGSGPPADPDGQMIEKRLNKDYFANLKAMSWWSLRMRFQATYRAVVQGMPHRPDELISIDPALKDLTALCMELSQPTFSVNGVGKLVIDKQPDGARSPNLADAVCIAYNPGSQSQSLRVWLKLAEGM